MNNNSSSSSKSNRRRWPHVWPRTKHRKNEGKFLITIEPPRVFYCIITVALLIPLSLLVCSFIAVDSVDGGHANHSRPAASPSIDNSSNGNRLELELIYEKESDSLQQHDLSKRNSNNDEINLNKNSDSSSQLIQSTISDNNNTFDSSISNSNTSQQQQRQHSNNGTDGNEQWESKITIDEDSLKLPLYMRILATLACLIIFTIGVSGNFLVPLVVIKTKYLRNSTNLFLINLSMADLLLLIVSMPTVFIELHSRPETWLLGESMCKLSNFVEMLAANGSIFTILAISFERYYAICKPLKAGYKCTRLRATIIICIIWLLSIILTSPILIMAKSSETTYLDGSLVYNCILETDTYWTKMYVFISMFAFFCLPLLVLMLVYWLIGRRLIRENLAMSHSTTTSLATTSCEMSTTTNGNGNGHGTIAEHQSNPSAAYNYSVKSNRSTKATPPSTTTTTTTTTTRAPFINELMSMSIRKKMGPKKGSSLKYFICSPAPKTTTTTTTARPHNRDSNRSCACCPIEIHRCDSSSSSSEANHHHHHHHHHKASLPYPLKNPEEERTKSNQQLLINNKGAYSGECEFCCRLPNGAGHQDRKNKTPTICSQEGFIRFVQLNRKAGGLKSYQRRRHFADDDDSTGRRKDDGSNIDALNMEAGDVNETSNQSETGKIKTEEEAYDDKGCLRRNPFYMNHQIYIYKNLIALKRCLANKFMSQFFSQSPPPSSSHSSNSNSNNNSIQNGNVIDKIKEHELSLEKVKIDGEEEEEAQCEATSEANKSGGELVGALIMGGKQNDLDSSRRKQLNRLVSIDDYEDDEAAVEGSTPLIMGRSDLEGLNDAHAKFLTSSNAGAAVTADNNSTLRSITIPKVAGINPILSTSNANNNNNNNNNMVEVADNNNNNDNRRKKHKTSKRSKFSRSKFYWSKQFSTSSTGSTNTTSSGVPSTATTSVLLANDGPEYTLGQININTTTTTTTTTRAQAPLPATKHQDNHNNNNNNDQAAAPRPILHYTPSLKQLDCDKEEGCNEAKQLLSSNVVGLLSTKSGNLSLTSPSKKSAHFNINNLVVSGGSQPNDKGVELEKEVMINLRSSSFSSSTTPTLSSSSFSSTTHRTRSSRTPSPFSSKSSSPDSVFENHHNHPHHPHHPHHHQQQQQQQQQQQLHNDNNSNYLHGTNNNNKSHMELTTANSIISCTNNNNNKDNFLLYEEEEEEDDAFVEEEEENIDNAMDAGKKAPDKEHFNQLGDNHDLGENVAGAKNRLIDNNLMSEKKQQAHPEGPVVLAQASSNNNAENQKPTNKRNHNADYLKRIHLRRTDRSRSTSSFEHQHQQTNHCNHHHSCKLSQQQQHQQNFYHHFNLSRIHHSFLSHYNRKCVIQHPPYTNSHENPIHNNRSCRSCSQPSVCSSGHFNNGTNNHNGAQQLSELLVVQDLSKKQQMDSRRQVVVMLAFVVACFFLLFFPYRVFTIWLILSTEDQVKSLGMETYYNLTYFSRILIYLHSAINPIAYNLISTKFRRAFMSILFCRGPSTRRKFITEHNHNKNQQQRGLITSTNSSKRQSFSKEEHFNQRRALRHSDRQLTS